MDEELAQMAQANVQKCPSVYTNDCSDVSKFDVLFNCSSSILKLIFKSID